ncbi:MAG: flagellar protein [Clostridiales bacterium]|jgi:flagellar operon protein|nr:flagellar protein [Clostridiales bacterium]
MNKIENSSVELKETYFQRNNAQKPSVESRTFSDVLHSVQFSKHANTRLSSRDINLSREQLSRVEDGVALARSKGIRDSLVLVDNVALIVNVVSGTVITAADRKAGVFTNIDGAVIV